MENYETKKVGGHYETFAENGYVFTTYKEGDDNLYYTEKIISSNGVFPEGYYAMALSEALKIQKQIAEKLKDEDNQEGK